MKEAPLALIIVTLNSASKGANTTEDIFGLKALLEATLLYFHNELAQIHVT